MTPVPIQTSLNSSATQEIDVVEFIDNQPVVRFHIEILLICASVLFLDGFDAQSIGYVAPALAREWSLPRGAMGTVFSAGLSGLMISALVVGPIADHVGRRPVIILSTLGFGLFTLLTTFAQNTSWLIILRFLTGLGLGAAMPNAVALVSEFSPRSRRATLIMLSLVGFSLGSILGGLVSAALVEAFGWRCVFVVGGVTTFFI
jgi:AAHS family 4-hydroxybenzoate transporter-like MFS transporter